MPDATRALCAIACLFLWLADPAFAGGAEVFTAAGCAGCHAVTPPPADFDLDGRLAEKGPNLWYAGSKYRPGWITRWLANPTPISGIRHDSHLPSTDLEPHPALGGEGGAAVAAYLESLTDPAMVTGVIDAASPMPRMTSIQGRMLFGKEQQCFACHKTLTRYGVLVGGESGPTLANATERLNPDWILAFLMDPRRYTPVTRMPIYRGDTFTDYGDGQMRILARYIADMGKAEP